MHGDLDPAALAAQALQRASSRSPRTPDAKAHSKTRRRRL
jgi:hypothetical protein